MGCFGAGFGVERSCFVFLGRWVVLAAFACVDRLTLVLGVGIYVFI